MKRELSEHERLARAARAHRKTLADALQFAHAAREAGDEETAAKYDRMAEHMRRKLAAG